MKMFSLLFVLSMSFASVASEEVVQSSQNSEMTKVEVQADAIEWRGCIAIDGNYNPYWGRTADEALNNCSSHSEIGDCKISHCQ